MEKWEIYTAENIKKVLTNKGYPIDGRKFYVNIIGVRNIDGRSNYFDDTIITLIYKPNGLAYKHYQATTDPGLFYLKNPINSKGTGILKEGYHKNCWQLGLHKGHQALVQVAPVTVYRDNDKDGDIDIVGVPEDTGLFGVNIHGRFFDGKSLDCNNQVGKWSAACTVFEKNQDLEDMLNDCRVSVRVGNGQRFSYTLLEHKDFTGLY